MSGGGIVSIVAMLGWLVLAFASYRSYQVDTSTTIRMALIWGCIFLGIAFLFSVLM